MINGVFFLLSAVKMLSSVFHCRLSIDLFPNRDLVHLCIKPLSSMVLKHATSAMILSKVAFSCFDTEKHL